MLDNIATVPLLLGHGRRKARARAAELLETVGLAADAGKRYPHQLSGGQQQRVGVARALAADPPVLLMDEPFGAVDPVVRTQLQDELLRLQKELNKTIVFVTHDVDEAVRLGDQHRDLQNRRPPRPVRLPHRTPRPPRRRRINYLDPKATAAEEGAMQNALTLALPKGLQILPYGTAEDSDAFVVTRQTAKKYGLTSLADLKKQNGRLVVGAAPEVKKRHVGAVGLKGVYGVEFKEFKSLDSDGPLVKGALKKGDVDVANLFTTDTDIEANDWVVLSDPLNLIPSQHIVPLIADRKADDTVRKALARLGNVLTTAQLTELNRQVDKDKKDPEDVANAYAKQHGLAK